MRRICVFCGSSSGSNGRYVESARKVGRTLARRGLGLVYGGGSVGLMGAVATSALEAGGEVDGVIPRALDARELAHGGLTRLHRVASMHERKAKMNELADAFIALPGGMGTLEELSEILTWAQLGLHAKPCGLLDVEGYYRPLVAFFDHAVAEGFLRDEQRQIVIVRDDVDALLGAFDEYEPPAVRRWIDPATT
jgi:uncharacterized protein (TIGR00730 family)